MQLLKFKIALLSIMGYLNGFASIMCIALALSNWTQSMLVVIFMSMSGIFMVLCIICLKGHEVEAENLKKLEQEKKIAMQESFRTMREAMKEASKD